MVWIYLFVALAVLLGTGFVALVFAFHIAGEKHDD